MRVKPLLLIILIIILASQTYALGIAPSHVDVTFEPGLEKTILLKIFNSANKDFDAVVYAAEGHLKDCIIIDQPVISFLSYEGWKIISYRIKLPESLGEPGTYQTNVVVGEIPSTLTRTMGVQGITATVEVASKLNVIVPTSSLPGDWWGKVTINGNPGNDGAVVDAYIDGIHIASATVGEFVSGYYLIHVEGKVGDFVYFKVNDIYVNEPPQQWSRGNHLQFDLTVNYCIPGETETVSCYTGPIGIEGVGICKTGNKTRVCQEDLTWGEYSSCIGEILPQYEICDALDNDCDGQTDEDWTELDDSCSAGLGECYAEGIYVCTQDGLGTECNAQEGTPTAEICDSLDNDCDGITDNGGDTLCDDGLWCNGAETCEGIDGCQPGTPPDCLDSNECTDDICNEDLDKCENPNLAQGTLCGQARDCLDSACNGVFAEIYPLDGHDTCDVAGTCVEYSCVMTDSYCSDSDPDDGINTLQCGAQCDQDSDCENTECDNPDGCVGNDYYDYDDVPNDCLGDCSCETNSCGAPTITENHPDCTECQTDDDCNDLDDDYCYGDLIKHDEGKCVEYACTTETTTVQDCNNLNNDYCYGTEIKHDDYTCDNANCILDETTLIQDCDNGQYCDGEETCADAACVAGTPIDCSDGVGCTMDSCNEETDSCDNTPDDSYCDDGLWCNGFETCDALDDCQAGTEVDCSDGVDCTLDSCNEQTDSCENNPDNTICDDGLFCNGIETCDALDDCQDGTPIDCSANNILGIETCDNIPDDYHPTWDYREAFISVCEEPGTCTTGDETIIHTCDYDTCGAECDATHSCLDTDCDNLDGCVGNDYYDYDDVPNDCLCDCNCEANTCGAPIEISYNDTRCVECNVSEKSKVCINETHAEVAYQWNYDTCGEPYNETKEDETCGCEYTCWEDDTCVDDGFMRQIRYETTEFEYCEDTQYQEIENSDCDCESEETSQECVSDGYAEVTYEWNYAYCGCSYTETVEDELCLCDYTEWTDDECVSDGYLRQTRTELSGYTYCTGELERTVEYPCCSCKYTEWQDFECVEDGIMRQIKTETTDFDYCEDEQYREVQNEACDCEAEETGRECVSDGYADLTYEWNYAYCGESYTGTVEDESCLCDYTEWQDDECVEDGIMKQIRNESSGHDYCDADLIREIEYTMCDCISSEISRECVANVTALVNYSWNYQYCGPDSEYVYDESCLMCTPNWICIEYSECTSENYQYCTQVQDTHSCGECYTEDYSEFTKECDYCGIHGPKIITDDTITVIEGDLVEIEFEVTDPDSTQLTYSISAPVGNDKQWQTQEGDKGEYNVLITVSDGICTAAKTVKIIVKAESQQSLIIKRTNYKEFIKPGQTQELFVTLENTGNENFEDLKITAFIDSLGIWKTTRKFDLKKGQETTKLIDFIIPSYAPKGRHYIRIVVSNDNIRRVIYRDFDVV